MTLKIVISIPATETGYEAGVTTSTDGYQHETILTPGESIDVYIHAANSVQVRELLPGTKQLVFDRRAGKSVVHVHGNSDGSSSGATDADALAAAKASVASAKVERMTCGSGSTGACDSRVLRLRAGDFEPDDLRAAVHDSMARADAAAQRGDGNPPASQPWHPNGTVAGLELLATGTLEHAAQSAEAHRQALEFAAVPELALAVANIGSSALNETTAKQLGTNMRQAIDALLGTGTETTGSETAAE